ncbi:MAG: M56 family metallopeptidase, partial [Clostridia bacterium]|nr:M56 family metallopeptidase [Clostridia bacterium]
MEMAITQLIFASITAVLFILANCAARKRVSACVRYAVCVVLVAVFMLPVRFPLMRINIQAETAETAYFEQTPAGSTQAGIETPALPNAVPPENSPYVPYAENLIVAIYVSGVIISLFCIFFRYCRAAKALQRCGRAPTEQEKRLLLEICAEQGVSRAPRMLVCPQNAIGSSLMFGFRRQTVLISDNMEEGALRLILGHEITHCKRKDSVFKAFLALLGSLYWFNPIIHLFIRTMNSLCEESCDEKFLSGSSYERKLQYCRLLIGTAAAKSKNKTIFTTFKGGSKTMKRRLENILNKKSKIVAAVLVVSVLLVTMLTSAIYFTLPPNNVKVAYLDEWDKVWSSLGENDTVKSDYDVEYQYSVNSDEITVTGIVNGKSFDVTGKLVSRNHNGAKLFYDFSPDKKGNYNVKHLSVQLAQHTEIEAPADHNPEHGSWNHSLKAFFSDFAKNNPKYKNMLALYLNPIGTDDILVIEIFLEEDFLTAYSAQNEVPYTEEGSKHLNWFVYW